MFTVGRERSFSASANRNAASLASLAIMLNAIVVRKSSPGCTSLQAQNGGTIAMATVSGTGLASYALLPMVLNGRYRYGIALANDNDTPLLATLNLSSPATTFILSIQVPARSQYVKFVDEIFNVPAEGVGTLEILANGTVGSGNFN